MKKNTQKIVFVEDEVDLRILSLAKKYRILKQSYFENLLIICCNYELLSQAEKMFGNAKYIFELLDVNDIQYQSYIKAKKGALQYFEKTKKQHRYLHYSLIPHLQETFYNILVSKFLIQQSIKVSGADFLIILPQRKIPFITFYKEFGFTKKNPIFGALVNDFVRREQEIEFKKIPWIFGILIFPKLVFQFLPGENLIELFLTGWHKLFRNKEFFNQAELSPNKVSDKKKESKIFINWGFDFKKHVDPTTFSQELKDLNIVNLLLEKEKFKNVSSKHNFYYKKPLRSYFFKNFLSFTFKIISNLAECLSILKKDSFLKEFYTRELVYTYVFLYAYGAAIIESYRKWIFSIFALFSPELFITSDLRNCVGRNFVFTAREKGAKVYTFNHGCSLFMPWVDPLNSLGDKILVSGKDISANFQKIGISKNRIVLTGEKKKVLHFSDYYEKRNQKTIVIVTSMKESSWIEPRNLFLFFKTIETLVDKLLKSNFKVIIKSHKIADYWGFYDSLVERYKNFPIEHVKRRWKFDELRACDAVIFPGGINSVILDCQAARVPIIYIDILSQVEKEILKYDYYNCGVIVKTAQQAFESVKRFFNDKEYLKNTLELGRQFYEDHIDTAKEFTKELSKILRI